MASKHAPGFNRQPASWNRLNGKSSLEAAPPDQITDIALFGRCNTWFKAGTPLSTHTPRLQQAAFHAASFEVNRCLLKLQQPTNHACFMVAHHTLRKHQYRSSLAPAFHDNCRKQTKDMAWGSAFVLPKSLGVLNVEEL